ncbi:hypothetical protein [Piscinibacter sp.]|nr:hypothetical protein [Piscinibacter sp.]
MKPRWGTRRRPDRDDTPSAHDLTPGSPDLCGGERAAQAGPVEST